MQISNNIKKYRELRGFSQQKVADEIQEKRSTYAEWENGTEPKTTALIKIAKVLEVPLAELLEGVDEIPLNGTNGSKEDKPGFIKTDRYLNMLEIQNDFLRRNFEVSLKSIAEGQHQNGIQLKALTWYSALVANKGDQTKADQDIARIHNRIASYEGVGDEGDNWREKDNSHTSAKQK